MDGRQRQSLTDEALDRELAAAFDVDPSPGFMARVRTRIADDAPGRRAGAWMARLSWAAALVLGVAAVGVWRNAPADTPASVEADLQVGLPPEGRAVEADVRPTPVEVDLQVGLSPEGRAVEADIQVGLPREGIGERPRRASNDGPPFSEVIVSIEQRRAFEQLVDAAEDGRLPAFIGETDPDNPFGIAPIEVEPLTLTDLRIGEPAEGEERP